MLAPPSSTSKTRHRLSNVDLEAREADCSVCETRVAIIKVGSGHQCAVARAETQRRYKKKNPEKARAWDKRNPEKRAASRRPGVSHQVIDVDWAQMRGYCVDCKRVMDLAPYGEGWVCRIRMEPVIPRVDPEVYGFLESGFHIVGPEFDPYYMPVYESVVPGWKTIGSASPEVRA